MVEILCIHMAVRVGSLFAEVRQSVCHSDYFFLFCVGLLFTPLSSCYLRSLFVCFLYTYLHCWNVKYFIQMQKGFSQEEADAPDIELAVGRRKHTNNPIMSP